MTRSPLPHSTVRWGLVGAGDVCERKSGPPLYQLPGHRLLALTRRDAAKGADFARRHAGKFVPDLKDLLEIPEINAVYIATPPGVHAAQTIAAAEAGKHVLVEKPMAMHTRECREMVAACKANGVDLAVAYYRRGYPSILAARTWVEQDRIGELREIWLNDQFPPSHRLDLVHFFAGELDRVRTETVEKGLVLHAVSHSGSALRMNLGWKEQPGAPEQVKLTGTKGSILIDDLKGGSAIVTTPSGTDPVKFPPLPWTHWGLIENFGHAIAGRVPHACSGEEGLKSTTVLDIVSALEPDSPFAPVDYANPPVPDSSRSGKLNLLG